MSVFCLCAFARASHVAAVMKLAHSQPAFAGLHSIDSGDVAAVLMADDDNAYSAQNLADQHWVMRAAALQSELLAALLGQGPVIPVRFGTLFASHMAVEDLLMRHRDVLLTALSELDGKAEWSVRAVCDKSRLSSWLSRQSQNSLPSQSGHASQFPHSAHASPAASGPGRRYLEQQREAQRSRLRVRDWLLAQSDALQAIAQVHAARFQPLPLPGRVGAGAEVRGGGSDGEGDADEAIPFWRASLLVDDAEATALHGALERLQQNWPSEVARLMLAGPWPPYSFGPVLAG